MVYIGQTIRGIDVRWSEHKAESRMKRYNTHLYNAMNSHKIHNFQIQVLCYAKCIQELNILEDYWIKFYDSRNREKGYNIKEGGKNGIVSEETRKKQSLSHTGKKKSPEFIEKCKKYHIYTKRSNIEFKGVYYSEKTKRFMVTLHIGLKSKRIGRYCNKEKAALNYDKSVILYGNGDEYLNFEELRQQLLLDKEHNILFIDKSDNDYISKNLSNKTYKGICLNRKLNRYVPMIKVNKKPVYFGSYKTEIEAAHVYDRAVIFYRDGESYMNFPELKEELIKQKKEGNFLIRSNNG